MKLHGQRKKLASPNARDTNMLVFLALGDADLLSFALGDAKVPNARYFAFWWNIGLRLIFEHFTSSCILRNADKHKAYISLHCKTTRVRSSCWVWKPPTQGVHVVTPYLPNATPNLPNATRTRAPGAPPPPPPPKLWLALAMYISCCLCRFQHEPSFW